MKKVLILFLVLILIAGSAGGIYFLREQFKPRIDTERLEFTVVQRGDLRDMIEITGKVIPQVGAKIMVGSRISGMVEELHVQVGDQVGKDALIAVIDTRELDRQIAVVRHQIDEVDKQYEQSVNRLQLQLEAEQLRQERHQIQYELALDEYARIADLYKREFQTITQYNSAYERLRGLEKELEARAKDIQRLQEELHHEAMIYIARLNQLEQQQGIREIQGSYARIKAPISGIITHIDTQQGETVAASFQTPNFVEIVDPNRLEVEAYVSEVDISLIKKDMTGFFHVDAMRNKNFTVRLREISPRGEIFKGAVSFQIMLEILDPYENLIFPEMTAYISLVKEEVPNTLYVDREAVRFFEGKRWVFTLENDRIMSREVKTGITDTGRLQILEGLRQGDEVILRGLSGTDIRQILERK